MDKLQAPFPWQRQQWQTLQQARQRDQLAHAWLIQGPAGTGKMALLKALIASLLCQRPDRDGHACGQCRGCTLHAAGNHPEFHRVEQQDSGNIKIDSIRELCSKLELTRQEPGYRVAVIAPAEAMNIHTANALLKTLEEPEPGNVLLLASSSPARLPATIRSRCQILGVSPPAHDEALKWLAGAAPEASQENLELVLDFSGNAPLTALQMLREDFSATQAQLLSEWETLCMRGVEPVHLAAEWVKSPGADVVIDWLVRISMALVHLKTGAGRQRLPDEIEASLRNVAEAVDLNQIFLYLDVLYYYRSLAGSQVNQTLMLEALLIPWWYKLQWPLESMINADPTRRAAAIWP